ncbi:MAG: FAD-binding oxidoreductase [Anaerolineae bacterium]|nr:FAD-binding oxidoreductase [Anaerolineae bacterium]
MRVFSNQLRGKITLPGDANYDEARAIWNGMIDRYPAIIAHCETVDDVVASVQFAHEQNLLVAVRGGGHNVAGHAVCDGGIVIDLSHMNAVEVDPEAKLARAQGGATLGEVDAATQAHGLAAAMGVVSKTGIAGLTLGGGFGWLSKKYGMACDNLVAAEVVTADGRVIRASETENRDLLWGLRGGGGNFGIVTSFELRLHPVGPEVMFVFALHDGEGDRMKSALQFYLDFAANAPEDVNGLAAIGKIPHTEHFPEELHGRPFVLTVALYTGDAKTGEQVLQPLRDFHPPLVDMSGIMPYVEAQQMFDPDYPDGMRYYWKSLNLNYLDDTALDRIIEHARQQPSEFSTTDLWPIGGAVRQFGPETSAYAGRGAAYLINPEANWVDAADDDANVEWVRDFIADMQEFSDGGRYLNFAGFQEEGEDMMRKAFAGNYQRLAELKRKYDPENFFRLNQNINPSA